MDLDLLRQRYLGETAASARAFREAARLIPGGVQGNIKYFDPHPLSFASAEGSWLTDADGRRYVDFLLSFGALALGHGHEVVRRAIAEALEGYGTTSFGMPYELERVMARKISERFPSIATVRFTNSGLEATLLAIRIALAASGRTHIAKFDGHYHGGHDRVLVNTTGGRRPGGGDPVAHADSLGLAAYHLEHTVVLPFNDVESSSRILKGRSGEVGAVVVEPVQAGYIEPEPGFLNAVRALTSDLGMVLIFDEVKTGFRTALGGAQEYYGVEPDLTALGKILGGGLPIGAVGGRGDLMELCSPARSRNLADVVFHSGTFNGNPMSLATGLATIGHLEEPGRFDELLVGTEALKRGIVASGRAHGFNVETPGAGTIFNVAVGLQDEGDAREFSPQFLRQCLDYSLMHYGVFSKPMNRFSMATSHRNAEIAHTLSAFDSAFGELATLVEGAR